MDTLNEVGSVEEEVGFFYLGIIVRESVFKWINLYGVDYYARNGNLNLFKLKLY